MSFLRTAVKSVTTYPYYFIKSRPWVLRLLNTPSRRLQERAPLPLNALQKTMVDALHADGIYVTHIDTLFPGENLLPKLQAYAQGLEGRAQVSDKKDFYRDFWDYNHFVLDLTKNPLLRFSLSPLIIGIANAYMGLYVRMHSLRLMKTILVPQGRKPQQSQLWHRDGGSGTYLKVFLYLNDVDQKTGPFSYVKGTQPGGRWEHIFPHPGLYSAGYPRIEDAEVDAIVPQSDQVTCMGRAGTMVFVDTVGIHKGGYSTHTERVTLLATFFPKVSLTRVKRRKKFIYPEDFEDRLKMLSPQAQFAIRKLY